MVLEDLAKSMAVIVLTPEEELVIVDVAGLIALPTSIFSLWKGFIEPYWSRKHLEQASKVSWYGQLTLKVSQGTGNPKDNFFIF